MVLSLGQALESRSVLLGESLGLVLAEDVVARFAVPPFDNSAMDGFAIRTLDVAHPPVTLRVTEDIAAGAFESHTISHGEAARIMTGAPLPEGADAVVPVEETDAVLGPAPLPSSVEIRDRVSPGRHIRRRGEDVGEGNLVLTAGTRLNPAAVASAAAVGYGEVRVVRRPRVGVIATGAELELPGAALAPGQVPDSNSVLLLGLLTQFGADVVTRTSSDNPSEFRAILDEVASGVDLIVTTGGVSVGAFDVVRQVIGDDGDFGRVAMQPGKPQGMGRYRGIPLLAFPGNPVSVFVSAWLFARPLIARLSGAEYRHSWISARAGISWTSPTGRAQYLPAVFVEDVIPAHRLGSQSHAIGLLHLANVLARVGAETEEVRDGDKVEVMFLND